MSLNLCHVFPHWKKNFQFYLHSQVPHTTNLEFVPLKKKTGPAALAINHLHPHMDCCFNLPLHGKVKQDSHQRRIIKGEKKNIKLPYNMAKDICRVCSTRRKCKEYGNRINDLRYLLFVWMFMDNVLEDPPNFLNVKRILIVIRTASEVRQILGIVEKTNKGI